MDGLFLYTTGRDVLLARNTLPGALYLVIPWLQTLGFSISISKCQFCIFTKSRVNLSEIFLSAESHDLPCLGEMKYLEAILDRRLTWTFHVCMILGRVIGSINIIQIFVRVTWDATSSFLLVAYKKSPDVGSCTIHSLQRCFGMHEVHPHFYSALRIWGVPP